MSPKLQLAKMLRAAMNEALEKRAGLPPITINRPVRKSRRRMRSISEAEDARLSRAECDWHYGGECRCNGPHGLARFDSVQLALPLGKRP